MPPLVEALARGADLLTVKASSSPHYTATPTRGEPRFLSLPARHLIKHYADHYYINSASRWR